LLPAECESGYLEDGATPLEINTPESVPFENEEVRGELLFLHRPSPELEEAWPYKEHFASKERRWEFRIRLIFKVAPQEAFFTVELSHDPQIGPLSRVTVKTILAFVSTINATLGTGFWYNLEVELGENPDAAGEVELPHFIWPLLKADAILATPLGEVPPPLTEAVESSPNRSSIVLDTAHTFTFVYNSKYVDFMKWQLCHIMGVDWFLDECIDKQNLFFSVYRLKSHELPRAHVNGNKRHFLRWMIVHPRAAPLEESASRRGPRSASSSTNLRGDGSEWASDLDSEDSDSISTPSALEAALVAPRLGAKLAESGVFAHTSLDGCCRCYASCFGGLASLFRRHSKQSSLAQEEAARRFGRQHGAPTSPEQPSRRLREPEGNNEVIIMVWELQRRHTVFHDWQAPFFPTDGDKVWRWVDLDYRKHPWAVHKCETYATSDVPVIRPPHSWRGEWTQPNGCGWIVAEPGGPCDERGWQYAMGFYQDSSWWGDSPLFRHCRRRLWKGTFLRNRRPGMEA